MLDLPAPRKQEQRECEAEAELIIERARKEAAERVRAVSFP